MLSRLMLKISKFFLWLAGGEEQVDADKQKEESTSEPAPSQKPEYWEMLIGSRNNISGRVIVNIKERLMNRLPVGRDHAADDRLFAPLATETTVAIAKEEYQLAISMFYECYDLVRSYEGHHGVEVHKGAMTFNVAIAFLRSHDFSAAMHYFELSKYETEKSYGHANWDVFTSYLFDRNYWSLIDLYEKDKPLEIYYELWGANYGMATAKTDWNALSDNSKLLYLMLGAERIRYSRLKSQPNWNGADSVGLSYWNMASDLVRLLETEVKALGITGSGLNDMVLNRINSPVPNFRTNVTAFRIAHPIHSPTDFNTHFPALRSVIEDHNEKTERRIACSAYLVGSARNQVQHQVDTGMILFSDRSSAVFMVNTFFALCRLRDWVA